MNLEILISVLQIFSRRFQEQDDGSGIWKKFFLLISAEDIPLSGKKYLGHAYKFQSIKYRQQNNSIL